MREDIAAQLHPDDLKYIEDRCAEAASYVRGLESKPRTADEERVFELALALLKLRHAVRSDAEDSELNRLAREAIRRFTSSSAPST
jgi:hypothetical protein